MDGSGHTGMRTGYNVSAGYAADNAVMDAEAQAQAQAQSHGQNQGQGQGQGHGHGPTSEKSSLVNTAVDGLIAGSGLPIAVAPTVQREQARETGGPASSPHSIQRRMAVSETLSGGGGAVPAGSVCGVSDAGRLDQMRDQDRGFGRVLGEVVPEGTGADDDFSGAVEQRSSRVETTDERVVEGVDGQRDENGQSQCLKVTGGIEQRRKWENGRSS